MASQEQQPTGSGAPPPPGGGGSSAAGGGAGGKSLALMQQRFLKSGEAGNNEATPGASATTATTPTATTTMTPTPPSVAQTLHPEQSSGSPVARPSPLARGGKSAEQLLQARQKQMSAAAAAAAVVSNAPPENAAAGRPKGKDLSSMAKRAGGKDLSAMQQQQVKIVAPVADVAPPQPSSSPVSQLNRPKGKDFASMSKRSGPVPNPVGNPHAAMEYSAAARAAQMQAAARAAAGMPPLDSSATTLQAPVLRQVPTLPPMPAIVPVVTAINPPPKVTSPVLVQPPQPNRHIGVSPKFVPAAAQAIAEQARIQHQLKLEKAQRDQVKTAANAMASPPSNMQGVRQPAPSPHTNVKQSLSSPQNKAGISRVSSIGSNLTAGAQKRTTSIAPSPAAAPVPAPAPPPARPTPQPTRTEAFVQSRPRAGNNSGGVVPVNVAPMLGQRLSGLLDSLDPMYTLEPDAEEQVLKMADTFMEQVTRQGLLMARHRGSNTLDVKDLQLVLQKQWGIVVPGLGAPPSRNQRIATIRGATSTASNATISDGGNDSKEPPATSTTMTTGSGNKRRPSTSSATSNFSNRSKKTKTNATTHSAAATTS